MKWSKTPWFWFALLLVATAVLLMWLNTIFPGRLSSRDSQIDLTRAALVLGLVAGSLFMHRHMKLNHVLRNVALWTGIGGIIFLGYSLRDEAKWLGNRMIAELVPSSGRSDTESIRFARSANGHFIVDVLVDNTPVSFLVDTGASDIVLSPDDATRLGFDITALRYSKIYNTANGQVRGAPVELGVLRLGPIRLTRVRASVNGAPMNRSLLGMGFLDHLSRYEVTGNRLILYP